ncbi:TIGR03943 family protein [Streptomyces sp. ISL-98]|uniref:TIGR03943 family putative permease subunit n=1 Tax=Streptomyces sp. ISL-98 TaxID=2819192 RepID=UPI001BEA6AA7|nr:TIGR03943 family protein [Streptomyces sp. ISL-98]MBT2510410.1 TIGR03943 family protein [Streptomyces sp. ISL-98]
MKAGLQPALLLLTGAAVLRVSLFSDICLRYVKEGLQPLLVATGVALAAVGLIGVLRREPSSGSGHDHAHGPRVAWLLLVPALALLLFPPPALGSYTAARDNAKVVEDYARFEPLPAKGPVPLSLTEYIARAQQDDTQSLKGRTVLLSGFVTPGRGGTWELTRLLVACCAADSQSLTVTMYGAKAPPADTWVKVTGTWHERGTYGTASAALALDVTSLQRIPEPSSPYLDRAPEVG